MSARFYIILIAAVLLLTVPAGASGTATIHGVVYGWDTFEPLENAVVEVNSTPSQSMVAKYGLYSFELAPGNYTITASYYQNSTLTYSKEEAISVEDEGNYVLDLLLLPVYAEELMDFSDLPESESPDTEMEASSGKTGPETTPVEEQANTPASTDNTQTGTDNSENKEATSPTTLHFFAGLAFSLMLVGTYHYFQRSKGSERRPAEKKEQERNLKPEQKKVLNPGQEKTLKPEQERLKTGLAPEQKDKVPAEKKALHEGKAAENREGLFALKKIATESTKPYESGLKEQERLEGPEKSGKTEESEKSGKSGKSDGPETPEDKHRKYLPPDLQEVMDIIRDQGGRITQKELRSRIKYSEGKVSLMLADLERRGLIEKFKRGRGNVVILQDENH